MVLLTLVEYWQKLSYHWHGQQTVCHKSIQLVCAQRCGVTSLLYNRGHVISHRDSIARLQMCTLQNFSLCWQKRNRLDFCSSSSSFCAKTCWAIRQLRPCTSSGSPRRTRNERSSVKRRHSCGVFKPFAITHKTMYPNQICMRKMLMPQLQLFLGNLINFG
jgi:hypothetical protein